MSTFMSAWLNPCALAQAVAGLLLSSCAHPVCDKGPVPVSAPDLTVEKLERRGVHKKVSARFRGEAGSFADPRGFDAFYPGRGHTVDNIVTGPRSSACANS
jgi:hypothetical protein